MSHNQDSDRTDEHLSVLVSSNEPGMDPRPPTVRLLNLKTSLAKVPPSLQRHDMKTPAAEWTKGQIVLNIDRQSSWVSLRRRRGSGPAPGGSAPLGAPPKFAGSRWRFALMSLMSARTDVAGVTHALQRDSQQRVGAHEVISGLYSTFYMQILVHVDEAFTAFRLTGSTSTVFGFILNIQQKMTKIHVF